ncbi:MULTISPECIES: hypothetical protein [Neisseria]|uniref:hypothetical protein n=1 Tax=Neisseria TaxID=482 RepID=UPI00107245DF|nr:MULTISPECIES: hypothetical protein [Neisseria]MBF0804129.1 hypothetical protein [Neisseria sp. 19428wB4_WF04]TFU43146.1 hypothetical protein E4T99_07125 [Neisseria sp. WF04]
MSDAVILKSNPDMAHKYIEILNILKYKDIEIMKKQTSRLPNFQTALKYSSKYPLYYKTKMRVSGTGRLENQNTAQDSTQSGRLNIFRRPFHS